MKFHPLQAIAANTASRAMLHKSLNKGSAVRRKLRSCHPLILHVGKSVSQGKSLDVLVCTGFMNA